MISSSLLRFCWDATQYSGSCFRIYSVSWRGLTGTSGEFRSSAGYAPGGGRWSRVLCLAAVLLYCQIALCVLTLSSAFRILLGTFKEPCCRAAQPFSTQDRKGAGNVTTCVVTRQLRVPVVGCFRRSRVLAGRWPAHPVCTRIQDPIFHV